MDRLALRIPGLRDMAYRQRMLADPDTMAYNRGRDLGGAEGYDPETGCIAFPSEDWRYWRSVWLWNEPSFFSALLWNEQENCFVGEVTCFYDAGSDSHMAGILIEARHRGKGYCAEGLRLLAAHAFRRDDIAALRCPVPADAPAAITGYRRAGFHILARDENTVTMLYTREDYERDGMEGPADA